MKIGVATLRFGCVTGLMPSNVICCIGKISPARLERLLARLRDHFTGLVSRVS